MGVIAFGIATENWKSKEIDGNQDQEYYIKLDFKWQIDPDNEPNRAVKSWEINKEMKSGHRFRQTVFSISEEMAYVIENIAKVK